MDWLDFCAAVIRSLLGWPVAVVAVAWLLRAELRGLVRRLEEVHHGDTKAIFAAVDQLADDVGNLRSISPAKASSGTPPLEGGDETAQPLLPAVTHRVIRSRVRASRLAEELADCPQSAVRASWVVVEQALRDLGRIAGHDDLTDTADDEWPRSLIDRLRERQILDDDERRLLLAAWSIRGKMAHIPSSQHEVASAMRYSQAADTLANILSDLGSKLP